MPATPWEKLGICDAVVGAEPQRHEGPVRRPVGDVLPLGEQHGGGVLGELARAGDAGAPGPQRAEQYPGRAEDDVVDARAGQEARLLEDGLRPAVGRGEGRAAGPRRRPCRRLAERDEHADGADQPVEVGAVRLGRDVGAQPLGDRRPRARSSAVHVATEPDLGEREGEPADAAVHAVAVGGARAAPGTDSGIHGPSVVPAHLVEHPPPPGLGNLAIGLDPGHRPYPPATEPRSHTRAHVGAKTKSLAALTQERCRPQPSDRFPAPTRLSGGHPATPVYRLGPGKGGGQRVSVDNSGGCGQLGAGSRVHM